MEAIVNADKTVKGGHDLDDLNSQTALFWRRTKRNDKFCVREESHAGRT